jgi:hypothetical protein
LDDLDLDENWASPIVGARFIFLEYWPLKYAGFGAGYRYVAAESEHDTGDKTTKYDLRLPGPLLHLTFGF